MLSVSYVRFPDPKSTQMDPKSNALQMLSIGQHYNTLKNVNHYV